MECSFINGVDGKFVADLAPINIYQGFKYLDKEGYEALHRSLIQGLSSVKSAEITVVLFRKAVDILLCCMGVSDEESKSILKDHQEEGAPEF